MKVSVPRHSNHKAWRRIAKKERRRRLRRKAAEEREAREEQLRAALERSAEYLKWMEEQETLEKERQERELKEHAEREKLWLEEEERAQKEWQILQEKKAKARQQQLEQEAKIREEFEAKQEAIRKKREEEKRKHEEETRRQEELQKEIDDYIDNGIQTPEALHEAIDSQPGKELCPFFTKTGACRYGDSCSRNHRRVCLSKVILVPGFYSHFSLEKNSAEYDTDIALEFESSETRHHFREFYKDVVPELESFGRIRTLKCCCNSEIHLRGNLYVEYYTEREAARALRGLKGRWYAGRQLNCEFANLKSWRSAICGMQKCPKGRTCNFLHTFRNPRDEYDVKSPPRRPKQTPSAQENTSSRRRSKWEESTRSELDDDRNWRWSESPEAEVLDYQVSSTEKRHRHTGERDHRRSSRHDRRRHESDRRSSKNSTHSSRRNGDERIKDDSDEHEHHSRRSYSSKSRKRRHEESADGYDESKDRQGHRSRHVISENGKSHRSKRMRRSRSGSKNGVEDQQSPKKKNKRLGESVDVSPSEENKTKDEELENLRNSHRGVAEDSRGQKSKWDKQDPNETSSSSTDSSDAESSKILDEKIQRPIEKSKETQTKRSKDEWDTTDSETEVDSQKNR